MSDDATISPPRSSSVPLAIDANVPLEPNSGDGDNEAAVQADVREEASGESEGKGDSKQKRKRTSPADQAILESEYKQNPKPNKAARADIVKKVSLNEKEVQIWFQNRRQIHRRKSRPLLPHEIAAFGLGGMAALSSDPTTMIPSSSSQSGGEAVTSSQPEPERSQDETEVHQTEAEALQKASNDAAVEMARVASELVADEAMPVLPPMLKRQGSSGISFSSSFSATENVATSFSSNPGYLSNRWNSINGTFSTPVSAEKAVFTTPPISHPDQPSSCPERIDESQSTPKSHVRLSLSLDGKAELVSTIPSPPRQHPPRPSSSSGSFIPMKRMRLLERSQSAYVPHTSSTQTNPPRLISGRSRDARSWEFCCDPEARDELTLQAENESHGSAVAAISLIRSSSSAALKPNSNKRNTLSQKPDLSKVKKPKLGRAMSSLARLQNSSIKMTSQEKDQPSKVGKDGLLHSPSGDSDKENWLPNEAPSGNQRRRPLPSSRTEKPISSRSVLGDNHNVPSHATNFGGIKHRKRKSGNISTDVFEDQENEDENGLGIKVAKKVPEDVQRFMSGEISPSKKGDLDCVQGLLSLSQGNWR